MTNRQTENERKYQGEKKKKVRGKLKTSKRRLKALN